MHVSDPNDQMVENAYKVTLVYAFVPRVAGIYWKRANNLGAGFSIVLGFGCWIAMEFVAPEAALPPQSVGLIASALGMVAGSLATRRRQAQRRAGAVAHVARRQKRTECRKILHTATKKHLTK